MVAKTRSKVNNRAQDSVAILTISDSDKLSKAKKRRMLRKKKAQNIDTSNGIQLTQQISKPVAAVKSKQELYSNFKEYQLYHAESQSELPKNLGKYWYQRYILFSKYDEGIYLDKEGWYSVTPEPIAQHVAKRCKNKLVIDAFCGSGGNAIQFALHCDKVIAIDKDPVKIKLAQHNAKVYNVDHKIEFINADFLEIAPTLKADVVYLSPPWGGVEYLGQTVYDLSMLLPIHGKDLFELSSRISPNIIYFLPKNTDPKQIAQLSNGEFCEIEQNYIYNSIKGITAYFNGCANKNIHV